MASSYKLKCENPFPGGQYVAGSWENLCIPVGKHLSYRRRWTKCSNTLQQHSPALKLSAYMKIWQNSWFQEKFGHCSQMHGCDAWGCSEEWPGVGLLWSLWSPSNSGYSHFVIDCMIWSSCLQSATDSKYLLNYAPQVSICLSFNKQAGFVSFPFWLNLFIAKSNKKLRLFMVLELNVIGKFPRCWQEILQTTAAVLLSSFDFSISCGIFYRFHFSQDLKYCCPFPWL